MKKFAEIWEEEKSKYQKLYEKELKENKGLIKLGRRNSKKEDS